ncbi:hypothetical protein AB6A40_004836 [Gnathostoma spinigerum]|uniref:SXP/RAL-2 family protein Ani s 5-like cation-binding domain-containing protein n=1 Tax=Gnathostoma spinigerum TaxID=75299 RepID=A0ABD6ENK3_9BILA
MDALFFWLLFVTMRTVQLRDESNPPFLRDADLKIVDEFRLLLDESTNMTAPQIRIKVEGWIANQSSQIQIAFSKFEEEVEKVRKDAMMAHDVRVAELSSDVQKADLQMMAIASDENLTEKEKETQIVTIMNGLDPSKRSELIRSITAEDISTS